MFVCPKHRVLSSCCNISGWMKQALIRLALSWWLVPVSLLLVTKLADCQDVSWQDELLQLFVHSYYKQWSESNPLGTVNSQRSFVFFFFKSAISLVNNFLFLRNIINGSMDCSLELELINSFMSPALIRPTSWKCTLPVLNTNEYIGFQVVENLFFILNNLQMWDITS